MFDQVQRPRVRAFVGPRAEQRAELCGHWLKALTGDQRSVEWCVTRGIALVKAQSELVNSDGGFLAPVDFMNAVIAVREAYGAYRQGADVRPLRSVSATRPRKIGGVTAHFVDEGEAIPESAFELGAIGVTARRIAVLVRSSAELYEDTAVDVAEYVAAETGAAFAQREDECGFVGDGSAAYSRIVGLVARLTGTKGSVDAAAGHGAFSAVDSTDLGSLVGAVLGSAIPGAAWYCNPIAYGAVFCRLSATGGLIATRRSDGRLDASFQGFPIRMTGALPDGSASLVGAPMVLFGDLQMSSMLAEARRLTIAISQDRLLDRDEVLLRGTQRLDLVTHSTADATTRGPMAMLLGKA